MLTYVGLGWAYVGPMLALCWPHVGPMLSHLGGYVGHMLGICWLSWVWRASTHKMSIKPVRPARITDTTLEKHSIFAFFLFPRVVLRYAQ